MVLLHELQGDTNHCLYHATYALTHAPEWLAYARDGPGDPGNDYLWTQRLAQVGIYPFPHHVTQQAYSAPTDNGFWVWQREHAHSISPGELPLMITIWGNRLYHAVAALIDTTSGEVTISDSNEPGLQTFTWAEFLYSRYARAYRVEMLTALHPAEEPSAG